MEKENRDTQSDKKQTEANHVGGINHELGGVDPEIETTLMRLSGGP